MPARSVVTRASRPATRASFSGVLCQARGPGAGAHGYLVPFYRLGQARAQEGGVVPYQVAALVFYAEQPTAEQALPPLLEQIAIILVLAFVFGTLASRLRMPPIVGYLAAGLIAGPFT